MKADDKALVTEQTAALPVTVRLAIAYATPVSRPPLTLIFALDLRLAGIVRNSREPMLAQMRLAWWRERLAEGNEGGTASDPLLALLAYWPGQRVPLATLADGWEAMTGAAPLPQGAFLQLAEARAGAFAALAGAAYQAAAERMARNWALFDLVTHLSDPRERETALSLARSQNWQRASLPRGLRPLAVLHGLAARAIHVENPASGPSPGMLLRAMRIGLFGR